MLIVLLRIVCPFDRGTADHEYAYRSVRSVADRCPTDLVVLIIVLLIIAMPIVVLLIVVMPIALLLTFVMLIVALLIAIVPQ